MVKKTPLYENHLNHGGKVVEFAGYYLPIQYEAGIKAEHNCVRENVGIFDVSHMGEFIICGVDATKAVNYLVSNDISNMVDGQVKYTLMLNDNGGIVDDLLVYRMSEEEYLLVVNASNCEKDAKWVQTHLIGDVTFSNPSDKIGQVALQGPNADKVLRKLTADVPEKYYTFVTTSLLGCDALISRTGYTGEDGFEIYSEDKNIGKIFEAIIEAGKEFDLLCCGLGARDTLRFEACLPLYGHELDETYRAHELALGMFVKMDKADFIGKQALLDNAPMWKRKGVKLVDRGIAREGSKVFDMDNNEIGFVTTGTMSPTLGQAIAMVRIHKSYEGEYVNIDVRGKMLKAEVIKMPFYKRASK